MDAHGLGEAPLEAGQLPRTDAARQHLGLSPEAGAPRPRKSTARLLWALFSLFVIYGTTFPFDFSWDLESFLRAARRINWRPLGGTADNVVISDIVQNIMLFLPFGFLGYFSLVHKSSRWRKAVIVLLGGTLSACVEFLQIFSPVRYPALSDVIFNTAGSAAGLAAAMALKRTVLGFKNLPVARRFLDAPSAFPAFIFLALLAAGAWEPFNFSLDYGIVVDHLKPLLRHPLEFKNPDDDLISLIRALLAGLFACRLLQEAGLRRPALAGTALVAALGVALEMSQTIIQSRAPEAQDAAVAVVGAVCGGIVYFFPGFHFRPRTWTAAGAIAVFASAAARNLYPYHFSPHYSGFNWKPFMPQFERSTFSALGDFLESAMTFFPIGFLLGYFFPRMRPTAPAALLCGGLALAVEAAQGFVPGRYADLTDVLGAMLGGVAAGLAITRGWPAFREYMRRDDDDQL
jgi:glycopeptide antibiotics resistance protein